MGGSMALDIMIRNGCIYDGLGSPGRITDLGIKNGIITSVSPESSQEAHLTIDATGKAVCPGFIDMHAHSGLVVFDSPELEPKIRQGVTTEVIGVDGIAAAPVSSEGMARRQKYLAPIDGIIQSEWAWRTFAEYLGALSKRGPGTNMCVFVPHGAVRDVVMGESNQPASRAEIASMCAIIEEAFETGAAGLSLGLIYYPNAVASIEEIRAAMAVAARYDRTVMVHMRNEADGILEALDEMACLAMQTGCRLHISHLKVIGSANKQLVDPLLVAVSHYAQAGVQISFDQYPYKAGSTQLATVLPPWVHRKKQTHMMELLQDMDVRAQVRHDISVGIPGWENIAGSCGWNNIHVTSLANGNNSQWLGCTVQEIAEQTQTEACDVVCDLLLSEDCQVGMIDFYSDDATLEAIIQHPLHTVGSDGIFSNGKPHPRLYGTFPRVLGRYVREKPLLSLESAVQNMTSRPANILGLKRRGQIKPGYWADIVVFDADTVMDRATYTQPRQYPAGIEWVLVNGDVSLDNRGNNHNRNGEVIRL